MSLPGLETLKLMYKHRKVLFTTTYFELKKRHSGSLLGTTWIILYPLLFLSIYLFLYLVIFKVQYPKLNTLESIIYIFSGLVPYIAFMEAINTSTTSIKQNMHLIKNVLFPIELIPVRIVFMAMLTQCVGIAMIVALVLVDESFSLHLLLLPVALIIQFFFLLGLVFIFSPLGTILPDSSYFVNLLTLALMFISPIGFMETMLPNSLKMVVFLNPIHYLIQPYRYTFLKENNIHILILLLIMLGSLSTYLIGAYFFKKFKNVLVDYE